MAENSEILLFPLVRLVATTGLQEEQYSSQEAGGRSWAKVAGVRKAVVRGEGEVEGGGGGANLWTS